jgi:hypothetical protein
LVVAGNFAIGTEGFMIPPLPRGMAADFFESLTGMKARERHGE